MIVRVLVFPSWHQPLTNVLILVRFSSPLEIQEASEALEGQSLPPPSPIPEDGENGGRISAAGSETAAAAITSAALQEKDPTAQKILALFSEIGSHQVLAKDFHPWFFYLENNCGKLQTVWKKKCEEKF